MLTYNSANSNGAIPHYSGKFGTIRHTIISLRELWVKMLDHKRNVTLSRKLLLRRGGLFDQIVSFFQKKLKLFLKCIKKAGLTFKLWNALFAASNCQLNFSFYALLIIHGSSTRQRSLKPCCRQHSMTSLSLM